MWSAVSHGERRRGASRGVPHGRCAGSPPGSRPASPPADRRRARPAGGFARARAVQLLQVPSWLSCDSLPVPDAQPPRLGNLRDGPGRSGHTLDRGFRGGRFASATPFAIHWIRRPDPQRIAAVFAIAYSLYPPTGPGSHVLECDLNVTFYGTPPEAT